MGYLRFLLQACIPHDEWVTIPDFKRDTVTKIIDMAVDKKEMKAFCDGILTHSDDIMAAFSDDSVDSDNNFEALEFLGDKVGSVVFIRYVEELANIPRLDQGLGTYLVSRFLSNKASSGFIQGHVLKHQKELWNLVSYIPDAEKKNQELDIAGDVFESVVGLTYSIFAPDTTNAFNVLSFMYNEYGVDKDILKYIDEGQYQDYATLLKEILRDRLQIQYDFDISKSPDGADKNIVQLVFRDSGFIVEEPGGQAAVDALLDGPGGHIELENDENLEFAQYMAAQNAYEWLQKNPVFANFMHISEERGQETRNLYEHIAKSIKAYNRNIAPINPRMMVSRYTRVPMKIKKGKSVFVITLYLDNGSTVTIENTSRRAAYDELLQTLQSLREQAINKKAAAMNKPGPATSR